MRERRVAGEVVAGLEDLDVADLAAGVAELEREREHAGGDVDVVGVDAGGGVVAELGERRERGVGRDGRAAAGRLAADADGDRRPGP